MIEPSGQDTPTDVLPGMPPVSRRVTIGVPVFNGMPYLPEAIDSLLAQDHPDLDIVICDNASTDGTSDYCRRLSSLVSRVRYHRFDTNVGAAVNFQRCLDLGTGEFFAWAAHDDRYDPRYVSVCLAALEQRPDAAMCSPAHRMINEAGALLEVRREPAGLADDDVAKRLRAHLWRRGWLTTYGLARRRHLEMAGPPPAVWGSDVILTWRLLLRAPILVVDEPLADYRVFRAKTEDAVLTGITALPSAVRWPQTGMRHALRDATDQLDIDAATRTIAERTLRRWIVSRHYRELLFSDLYLELRRLWMRGAHRKAAALAALMLVLSPRMVGRGLRLQWRIHRERRRHALL